MWVMAEDVRVEVDTDYVWEMFEIEWVKVEGY